jgi:hypothetical protein
MIEETPLFCYWAYGLIIASEIPLADLLPSKRSKADVHIRYAKLTEDLIAERMRASEVFDRSGRRVLVTENAFCIEWDKVGRILIQGGHEVLVDPEPGVPDDDLQPFLTGPVLAVLLHQQGNFVLHASAVAINGAAVLFLGSKGDGKSTLAAHLQVRGHQLISDDIVPVSFFDTEAVILPGFPRLKLYEDAIVAVGERPDRYPLIHRYVDKRSFRYSEEFPQGPLKLVGVYILTDSDRVRLEPMNPSSSFIEVTKHSFLNRFLAAMNSRQEHFKQCDQLVRSIPIANLSRPHHFEAMDEVCAVLEGHANVLVHRNTHS